MPNEASNQCRNRPQHLFHGVHLEYLNSNHVMLIVRKVKIRQDELVRYYQGNGPS